MKYLIKNVSSKDDEKDFLECPIHIYKDDKIWVRPLDSDITSVFDIKKNKALKKSEVRRWIVKDESNNVCGRIAAFYSVSELRKRDGIKTGGIGFFESDNLPEVANLLFNTSIKWLKDCGIQAVDGPINIGERDRWWGLLTEGFTSPNYCSNYNPLYYKDFFENYGFQNYFNQYSYERIVKSNLNPLISDKAKRIEESGDYHCENLSLKNKKKYAADFAEIYNQGWAKFPGIKKMSEQQVELIIKSISPILDTKLTYFAYHKNKPVGFFIMIPDINNIVKRLNGKMNLLGKIRFFLMMKYFLKPTKAVGLIFGIVPSHQGKGLHGYLVNEFAKNVFNNNFQYKTIELNWIGDFNPSMMKVCNEIGANIIKTHVTYRFLIDKNIVFSRAKKLS